MVTVSENPELVRLGDQLPELAQNHKRASARTRAILNKYQALWPRAPKELQLCPGDEAEWSLDGRGYAELGQFGFEISIRIATAADLRSEIPQLERQLTKIMKSKARRGLQHCEQRLENARKALPLAEAYEAECHSIRTESGYEKANASMNAVRETLKEHACQIMAIQEQSMIGVIIKAQAQALDAWSEVDRFHQVFNVDGIKWSQQMARSIMRQTGV